MLTPPPMPLVLVLHDATSSWVIALDPGTQGSRILDFEHRPEIARVTMNAVARGYQKASGADIVSIDRVIPEPLRVRLNQVLREDPGHDDSVYDILRATYGVRLIPSRLLPEALDRR